MAIEMRSELGTKKTATSFFSIIVPVYNVAPYLRECLDSVLAQTYPNWECLCVNDGSTDDSGAILDEYALRDPRFRVFHKKNGGVALARQFGLGRVQGEWLVWLDSDDIALPNFLMAFQQCIACHDVDLVLTDYYEQAETRKYVSQACDLDVNKIVKALLNAQLFGSLWNKAFSVDFLRECKISFEKYLFPVHEDLCFCCAVLAAQAKVAYRPVASYIYRQRAGSILNPLKSKNPTLKSFITMCNVQATLENILKDFGKDVWHELTLRRKKIKFRWYTLDIIPNRTFKQLYPEIKTLCSLDVCIAHKVLFWMATHGFRREVMMCFKVFRYLKEF